MNSQALAELIDDAWPNADRIAKPAVIADMARRHGSQFTSEQWRAMVLEEALRPTRHGSPSIAGLQVRIDAARSQEVREAEFREEPAADRESIVREKRARIASLKAAGGKGSTTIALLASLPRDKVPERYLRMWDGVDAMRRNGGLSILRGVMG